VGGYAAETQEIMAGLTYSGIQVAPGKEIAMRIVVGVVTGGALDFPLCIVGHPVVGGGMSQLRRGGYRHGRIERDGMIIAKVAPQVGTLPRRDAAHAGI